MTIHGKLNPTTHDDVLNRLAEELDIPESTFETAVGRYESLGRWLDRPNSSIKEMKPEISPQGSFLLGTVIKPLNDGEEYDVDLVCRLSARRTNITQKQLKAKVGAEIAGYAAAHSMSDPEDHRRCWRLNYAEGAMFHMDILPAIPDAERFRQLLNERGYVEFARSAERLTNEAISITDRQHPLYAQLTSDWYQSNPKGYGLWFQSRMLTQLHEEKRRYAKRGLVTASVDEIPDHKVKTPLQRAIQLLKRHRDYMFKDDPEHKPISIIITTLSAHSYSNEASIAAALENILSNMHVHIEDRGGIRWVANPVNPAENFADKWAEAPEKEANFWSWLEAARRDFGMYVRGSASSRLPERLAEAFGNRIVTRVLGTGSAAGLAMPAIPRSREDEAERARAAVAERLTTGNTSKPWQKL